MATAPDPIARPVLSPDTDAAVPPAPSTVAEVLKILITLIRPVRPFALTCALFLINSQLHWVTWIALETSSTEGTAPSPANRGGLAVAVDGLAWNQLQDLNNHFEVELGYEQEWRPEQEQGHQKTQLQTPKSLKRQKKVSLCRSSAIHV